MCPQETARAEIVAVGDVYLSRSFPKTALDGVDDVFERADAVIGNLESTLSSAGDKKFLYPWASLSSTPEMARGLEDFDAVSLANNHGMDYGPDALVETIDALSEYGVDVVGAGRTDADAERPVSIDAGDASVGVLAYEATQWSWNKMRAGTDSAGMNVLAVSPFYPDPGVSAFALDRLDAQIEAASEDYDVVFVMLHAGVAGDHAIAVPQRAIARRAAEAGADVILGSHPHILQGVEIHQGTPIIYSLSNFVFDSPSLDFPRETALARLELDGVDLDEVMLRPVYINDSGQPTPTDPETERHERIVSLLETLSEHEGVSLKRTETGVRVPI